ncbi:MAG: hypothetical protein HPY45_12710 [Anaerolineae bacterium]|nr:hypothetical protein [Anaerolineae bacterium]
MPAIPLSLLRKEIAELALLFEQPAEFHRKLLALFERYANRVYRPGQTIPPVKKTPLFHLPALVVNQIENDIGYLCEKRRQAGLSLVDHLWTDEHFETRTIAAGLLGRIAPTPPDEILVRIEAWCQPEQDDLILDTILQRASLRLRRETPQTWVNACETWLMREADFYKKIGLKGLIPLIQEREYENLPAVFQITAPHIKTAHTSLQAELQNVLLNLAQRSPVETAHFLQHIILTETNLKTSTARLIRQTLPKLPSETQDNLRLLIKQIR